VCNRYHLWRSGVQKNADTDGRGSGCMYTASSLPPTRTHAAWGTHAYGLLNLTCSFKKTCKTHAKIKHITPKSYPNHGGTIPAQYRIYTESGCPTEKAWYHMVRHGTPLELHVFLLFYNDFSCSPTQTHVFCMVSYPCELLSQCMLTRKTCHALSSLGVLLGFGPATFNLLLQVLI
jgi:hypothetical protein